jgi:ABC-type uncharacterized transport system substrate-binding protein
MTRVLSLVTLILALVAASLAAKAQPAGKVPRVGLIYTGSPPHRGVEAFRTGLRDLGYVEGRDIVLEYRWAAENRLGDLPDLAIELVRLRVDVIVAQTTAHAQAAKRATSTIPIVMGSVSDPVGSGLVGSLARPGGNVTGSSLRAPELAAKLLDLLKEALPRASRITALGNPDNPGAVLSRREVEAAAQVLGLKLDVVDVGEAKDLDRAFRASTAAHADAVIALPSPLFAVHRRRVAELALKNRLPAVSFETGFAEAGGLMSYGPNVPDMHRRAATYVDKILKGAKPGDLPVEQPTKFDLVINQKTAKALGLTIPPAVLARADEIIE